MGRQHLITLTTPGAEKQLRMLGRVFEGMPRELNKAARRAVNRTVTGMRKDISDLIRREYSVPAKDVKASLIIYRAVKNNLTASVEARGRMSIPLIRFGALPRVPRPKNPPKRGTTVIVKKAEGRKAVRPSDTVRTAFVARNAKGETHVYARKGEDRYPLRRLYGPSFLHVLRTEQGVATLQKQAEERLTKNLNHEADFVLREAGLR